MSDSPTVAGLPPRIADKIDASGDCWIWTAKVQPGDGRKRGGYGYAWWNGQDRPAHRVVWELLVGPLPAGTVLDHLCRVRRCTNPDHLRPCTHAENILAPGAGGYTRRMAERTHCSAGHLLGGANARPGAYRNCLTCEAERNRRCFGAWRVRNRDAWRQLRQAVAARDGWRCTWCGRQTSPHDHRSPAAGAIVWLPGADSVPATLATLATACGSCRAFRALRVPRSQNRIER